MLKKQSHISSSFSHIDSLKFSTFNYFGMGAVLPSVAESFWINFSAYYLNNIIPSHGNTIFLVAQIFEGLGILLGWLLLSKLAKCKSNKLSPNEENNKRCIQESFENLNLHMFVYIIGAILLAIFLPLVFLMPLSTTYSIFICSILAKIGSGLMIISQLSIIPKITLNKSRRRKLVQKLTQYGLAGTFFSMFIMTAVSVYVNFIWKYFFGVCGFVFIGTICSIMYVYKIRQIQILKSSNQSVTPEVCSQPTQANPVASSKNLLLRPKFYLYALIMTNCNLYLDIVVALYPYFIKSLQNISHFRYLSSITILYLSSLICSVITRNAFVFTGIRTVMTIGFGSCIMATTLLIIGLAQRQFGPLVVLGTALAGVAKVIASNCALNMVSQFIGKQVNRSQFVYGCFCFFEKIVTGVVLFLLISKVYIAADDQFLQFSQIFLPLILFSISWVLIMIDRTLKNKQKSNHIIIIEPNRLNLCNQRQKMTESENCQQAQAEKRNLQIEKNQQFYNQYDNHTGF